MKKAIILLPICSLGFLAGCKQPEPVVEYTVKFVNYDGSILQESKVEEGKKPVYEGQTPPSPLPEENHEYIYVGWDKEIEKVTADVTYTATFDYVFLFGSYPQTLVSDPDLIEKIETKGEGGLLDYKVYDGKYYLKFQSKANYKADDGTKVQIDDYNYYEVKNIKWKILGNEANKFYTTYNLLDANITYAPSKIKEDKYPNNYEESNIRTWLNGASSSDFLGRAFYKDDERAKIAKTKVKNDLPSTKDIIEPPEEPKYICGDTDDYVFSLSRQELRDPELGFDDSDSIDKDRLALTTDFARARGASTLNNYGMYWTRSPSQAEFSFEDTNVYNVLIDGFITFDSCYELNRCVRPAIKLI